MVAKISFLCLVSIGVIFLGTINNCLAETSDGLNQTKDNILTLVKNGNYAQAESDTSKLSVDFAGNKDLPESLYWIAEQCKWSNRFEDSSRIYQQVIQKDPNGPWADKARLGISKAEVLSLIMSQDYNQAEKALNKLTTEFAKRPDLPEALYPIGERYEWSNRFEDAKRVYKQTVQNHSGNFWANRAELGVPRVEVLSLIMTEDFAGAQKAIDKMTSDFEKNPDLAETLYWITERYRWFSRFDEEKGLYRQIIQENPESPYASKAKLGISRAEVMSFIMAKDYAGAKEALDKMAADFAGHPDLPEALFWIAERYEWFNKFQDAKGVYQRIMQEHSDSPYAGRARLGASMAEVRDIIISRDYSRSEEALNKVAAEFSGHSDWPRLITIAGEQYYKEGLSIEGKEGLSELAKDSFERAVKIWDGFISKNPDSELIPEVCCWAGDCYHKMGKYNDSIRCFGRVADKYPNYKHVWHALFMVGRNYESMKDSGLISKSDAEPKIKAAYTQLVEKYPACTPAKIAQEWLDSNNSK